ncbi:MAG: redoxin domain-containing protein [Chthoniobacterales bacterium]|nr:redoxin domain-containing protein [Chthoniobacterales bacterium]
MRALLFLVALSLAATAAGTLRPLSMKEVSLMLRSGYSSESVLHEITERRVLDPLHPAIRKSLADAGASPQLLTALESGQYRVDDATAAAAREAAAAASASQEQQAEKIYRSATATIKAQRAQTTAAARIPAGTPLLTALAGKLVLSRDGIITPVDPATEENKKLIAFYFSAHWCPPCRKFTPELVEYYHRVAPQHPEFELIFVSHDRSRFNWETYMHDDKMPWPAIDYDQLGNFNDLKQLGGPGIPSLVVMDAAGHVLASSYHGDGYLGPQNTLEALDKIFAQGVSAPVAQAGK